MGTKEVIVTGETVLVGRTGGRKGDGVIGDIYRVDGGVCGGVLALRVRRRLTVPYYTTGDIS